MSVSEFSLIETYFAKDRLDRADVSIGIGDDAAAVRVPTGHELLVSVDTLVSGVHFPVGTSAYDLAYKALAVNLSDMAAMGAEPAWFTLALTLPDSEAGWLADFSRGLFELADEHGVALIGGDTTCGPLTVSIQIMGYAPTGRCLRRKGAQVGDLIYASGQIGDGGIGLALLQQREVPPLSSAEEAYFIQRLNRPTPRVALGLALRGIASAAIDVSDGFVADLAHILEHSEVGACLNISTLPMATILKNDANAWQQALSAGDDYELCFTVPAQYAGLIDNLAMTLNCPLTCVGEIEIARGLRMRSVDGAVFPIDNKGYIHFD